MRSDLVRPARYFTIFKRSLSFENLVIISTSCVESDGWGNSPRGCGILYGGDIVENVSLISRIL